MIELPPGWVRNYQQSKDKPAFLRDWAAELERRAESALSQARQTELLEHAAAVRERADELARDA